MFSFDRFQFVFVIEFKLVFVIEFVILKLKFKLKFKLVFVKFIKFVLLIIEFFHYLKDMKPLDEFLNPCELRDETRCLILSGRLGATFTVTPVQCARCTLKGEPDTEFLNKLLLPEFAKQLEYIRLGFYESFEEIKFVIHAAFLFGFKVEVLTQMLDSYVELGRITEEQKEELLKPPEKKVEGVVDVTKQMVQVLMGGFSSDEEIQARREICEGCDAIDDSNEVMYREIDGKPYCGKPRLKSIVRDPSESGCGCNLENKWKFKKSSCPIKKWEAV